MPHAFLLDLLVLVINLYVVRTTAIIVPMPFLLDLLVLAINLYERLTEPKLTPAKLLDVLALKFFRLLPAITCSKKFS